MDKKEFRAQLLTKFDKQLEIAEIEGYWFSSYEDDKWFSPRQFKKLIKDGSFTFNPDNFALRKPEEFIDNLTNQTNDAINYLNRMCKMVIREINKGQQSIEIEPHDEE